MYVVSRTPCAARNARTAERCSSKSAETSTSRTPSTARARATASSEGNSSLHGAHHVAQTLITVARVPVRAASERTPSAATGTTGGGTESEPEDALAVAAARGVTPCKSRAEQPNVTAVAAASAITEREG